MKTLISALVALFLGASSAFAQCGTTLPGGTLCGNRTASQGLNGPLTNPVLGIPGTSTGQIGLAGSTSGTATIKPQNASGSPVLTLPNLTGTIPSTAVSPITLDSASGAIGCATCLTGGGGALIATAPLNITGSTISLQGATGTVATGSGGTGSAFSATPTLGVSGTTLGTLTLAGNTSGSVTLSPQAAAGTATALTLPNTSGTVPSTATPPITLNATTGAIACPTCATATLNGAALTAANDTNVTLTTGGTPNTALLNAASITAGWTGTLALSRGGLGGSQAAATANQVPVFPGSAGAAVPTSFSTWQPGTNANTLNTQTANYAIQTTDCGKTIQAGTGASGQFSITLPTVAGFASNCSVAIKNGDTGRGKLLSGFPSDVNTILWPGQDIGVKIVNGAWASFNKPGRWQLAASQTVFFDNTLGSDSNDCLAAGSGGACATPQHAWDLAAANFDCGVPANVITIQGANHTYTTGINTNQQPLNCAGMKSVVLDFGGGTINLGTAGNDLSFGSDASANSPFGSGPQLTIQNVTIANSGGGGLVAYGGSTQIYLGTGITFGTITGTAHMTAGHGALIYGKSYTISGGAGSSGLHAHAYAYSGGYIAIEQSGTVTCTGTPYAFNPFAYSQLSANISFAGTTFSGCGSVTGSRYQVGGGAYITSGGGGANFYPGNTAGIITGNGTYDSPGTPSVSCTGGTASPTPAGGSFDFQGNVTEGTASTGCSLTFTTASSPIACNVTTNNTTAAAALVITLLNSTTLTWSHPSSSGAFIWWVCRPPNG